MIPPRLVLPLLTVIPAAVAGVVFASPRSTGWILNASTAEIDRWLSIQATSGAIGAVLAVAVYALFAMLGDRTSNSATTRPHWVTVTLATLVLAVVKVSVPDAAGIDSLIALQVLKALAVGALLGGLAYTARGSRIARVALATGLLGGYLLVAARGRVDLLTNQFVPSRPFSTSVFGEPAWWLLAGAVVVGVVGVVWGPPSPRARFDTRTAGRMVLYATVVAVVGRSCEVALVSVIDRPSTGRTLVAGGAVALVVLTVDVMRRRWDGADSRLPMAAVAITAAAVSVWSGLRTTGAPPVVTLLVGVAAGAVGLIAAVRLGSTRLGRGSTLPLIALTLLAVAPAIGASTRAPAASIATVVTACIGLTLLLGCLPIAADRPDIAGHPADPDDSIVGFTLAIPGALGVLATAAMLPDRIAAPDFSLADFLASSRSLYVQYPATDRVGHLLMLAVIGYCGVRLYRSRPTIANR